MSAFLDQIYAHVANLSQLAARSLDESRSESAPTILSTSWSSTF